MGHVTRLSSLLKEIFSLEITKNNLHQTLLRLSVQINDFLNFSGIACEFLHEFEIYLNELKFVFRMINPNYC